MMKNIYTIYLLIISTSISYCQTLSIRDLESNEPIELATLLSENPKVSATTNAKGQVDISVFKNSEIIEIRSLGYMAVIRSYDQLNSDPYELKLEPTNLNLDEIVVSATRWRQFTNEIPSKIVSIRTKEVALQNPQTAADLLNLSGKVYIQKSQQGGGSPMIRGFATNRLLYTVDGVRMNTAIFRGGNIQNVISLDAFATENAEVLFGPGSVIYGSDAIGGVMNFQTLTPQFSLKDKPFVTGKAIGRFSSANDEQTGHFDINVGWKKWAMITSITSSDYDHLRQGSHGPDEYVKNYYVQRIDGIDQVINQEDQLLQIPSAYSQINLMQKIRFAPNDKWDIQYGFHHSESSTYGRYDRHNRVRNGSARYAEWNYGPQVWMMNNLNITHRDEHSFFDEISLRLAQQSFEESRISRNLNNDNREIRIEEVEAYSVNLDFVKTSSSKNTLFYGVEYIINDVKSSGIDEDISTGMKFPGASRYPQATWSSIAAYANDEYRVTDQFTVQCGLRYNQIILDAKFDTSFFPFPFTNVEINNGSITGSIGGVYRPTDTWVLSTNFGTAFRSPNVDDLGKVFDPEPGAVTVPNPELSAEYAYNVDLGLAKVIGNYIKIDVTGYYTVLQNAMVRRNFTLNGQDSIIYDGVLSQVQAIQNAAKANVYGLQAGIEIKLPSKFSFSSDFNYQKGEEELDNGTTSPSRHAAPIFGTTRLSYNFDNLSLQLYLNYQGERKHEELSVDEQGKDEIYAIDDIGNTYAPSWYTINFKTMYTINKNFTVNSGIENITDRRYRSYSSGISAPGRNFILSLKANF